MPSYHPRTAFFVQELEEAKVGSPPQLKPLSSPPPPEPPKVMVYPEMEVELGEPNILICMADNFSPPVLNMTWLKNGQLVTEGVQTMDYYPKKNHAFRRFSYLTFVPNQDDDYICEVDHWGLKEPLGKLWSKQKNGRGGWVAAVGGNHPPLGFFYTGQPFGSGVPWM